MKLWQRDSGSAATKPGSVAAKPSAPQAPDDGGIAIVADGVPTGELRLAQLPHPVTLALPTGERMPGRITRCTGTELQVLMLYQMQRPLGSEQLDQIVVEIDDGHNKTRLGGSTTLQDNETLGFSEMHVVQRREYVRVSASLPVEVTLAGSSDPLECHSVDVSGGGMLLRGVEHLHIGERLGFCIAIGEAAPPVTGKGTIVRCDEGGCRAICFDAITATDQQRLIRFLFERQREARRKGLLI